MCPFFSSSVRLRAANDSTRGAVRVRGRVTAWGGAVRARGIWWVLTCAHELVKEGSLRVHGREGKEPSRNPKPGGPFLHFPLYSGGFGFGFVLVGTRNRQGENPSAC